jgi:hypothetical protein
MGMAGEGVFVAEGGGGGGDLPQALRPLATQRRSHPGQAARLAVALAVALAASTRSLAQHRRGDNARSCCLLLQSRRAARGLCREQQHVQTNLARKMADEDGRSGGTEEPNGAGADRSEVDGAALVEGSDAAPADTTIDLRQQRGCAGTGETEPGRDPPVLTEKKDLSIHRRHGRPVLAVEGSGLTAKGKDEHA